MHDVGDQASMGTIIDCGHSAFIRAGQSALMNLRNKSQMSSWVDRIGMIPDSYTLNGTETAPS